MEQELSVAAGTPMRVLFTPQLAPMIRGILTTIYVRVGEDFDVKACVASAKKHLGSNLISVLQGDDLPDTLHVRGSGRAQIAYAHDKRTSMLIGMCAIDNLARGSSSQVIAAFNVSRGFEEAAGIPRIAQFP
jgi:N-acetyl-gamma-glutamyl-phosphate reductase